MTLYINYDYPKMLTANIGGRTVPLTYPAGDLKQFEYIVFENTLAENIYLANPNGVPPISPLPSGPPDSWENRHQLPDE